MGYTKFCCPHCRKKNKQSTNEWMYGSPIRVCKYCEKKYLDNRYREVAVEGVDNRSINVSLYLKGIIGFFIFSLVCITWLYYQIKVEGGYSSKLVCCCFGGILGTIGCGIMYIRIKLGIEDKNNAKYFAESEERLKNKDYVQELIVNGYDIPEKYL